MSAGNQPPPSIPKKPAIPRRPQSRLTGAQAPAPKAPQRPLRPGMGGAPKLPTKANPAPSLPSTEEQPQVELAQEASAVQPPMAESSPLETIAQAAPAQPAPMAAPLMPAAPMVIAPPTQPEADDGIQYGIAANGPPVDVSEVESAALAVEVIIMWGDQSVLQVDHLNPPRNFYLGESGDKKSPVDYIMGADLLGTKRMALVSVSGSQTQVTIPGGASGGVTRDGQFIAFESLRADGTLRPTNDALRSESYAIQHHDIVKIQYQGFTFIVKVVNAGKPVAVGPSIDPQPLWYIGGSLFIHVAFLLMFYFLPPSPESLSLDSLSSEADWSKYMLDAEEKEEAKQWLQARASDSGGQGERHAGDEGQMGKKDTSKTNTKKKYGVKGPKDNPDPHMAREQAKAAASTAGILGVLGGAMGTFDSPTSPFGRDTALGSDASSALGALMGDQIGENFGFGGLGMSGSGRGGGGTGEGTIGMGKMGTMGHGAGGGSGSGYGKGAGKLGGRGSAVPTIRAGNVKAFGGLSKEAVRRVIMRHRAEVRHCYEGELNKRPDLEGRVMIAFVISPTGVVTSAAVSSSTLGNATVEGCIARAVRRWSFPSADGGGVTSVNYPFLLSVSN